MGDPPIGGVLASPLSSEVPKPANAITATNARNSLAWQPAMHGPTGAGATARTELVFALEAHSDWSFTGGPAPYLLVQLYGT